MRAFLRSLGLAVLCGVLSLVFYYGVTASFGATTSATVGISTAGFGIPASTTYAAHELVDNSATDAQRLTVSDPLARVDGIQYSTKSNFQAAYSATRYVDFVYGLPLPPGQPVTDARFTFAMAPGSATQQGETGCFSVEVFRASTGALLARYPATPLTDFACVTGTTVVVRTVPLPEVTTTDVVNDLRVRVFGKEDKGHVFRIDQAVLEGGLLGPFTIFPRAAEDRSGGGGTTVVPPWSLDAADAVSYRSSAKNWARTFAPDRYLRFAFPTVISSQATITQVTLEHTYDSAADADSVCYYFEVFAGPTLLATHGSAASPVSCNPSKSGYRTDVVNLPELASPALLDGLAIKMFMTSSGAHESLTDALRLTVLYELPNTPAG